MITCFFFVFVFFVEGLLSIVELDTIRLLTERADIFSDHVSNLPEIHVSIQKLSDVQALSWSIVEIIICHMMTFGAASYSVHSA